MFGVALRSFRDPSSFRKPPCQFPNTAVPVSEYSFVVSEYKFPHTTIPVSEYSFVVSEYRFPNTTVPVSEYNRDRPPKPSLRRSRFWRRQERSLAPRPSTRVHRPQDAQEERGALAAELEQLRQRGTQSAKRIGELEVAGLGVVWTPEILQGSFLVSVVPNGSIVFLSVGLLVNTLTNIESESE